MDLQKLTDFFEERTSARALHEAIATESEAFAEKMQSGEGCIPLYGSNDDFRFIVRPGHVKLICHGYVQGHLTGWDTYYLCDLIMLSQSFTSGDSYVEESVYMMSDPVTGRPIARGAARVIFFWMDDPQSISLSESLAPYGASSGVGVGEWS